MKRIALAFAVILAPGAAWGQLGDIDTWEPENCISQPSQDNLGMTGVPYPDARDVLMRAGWEPSAAINQDDSVYVRSIGVEVTSCSADGYCRMNFIIGGVLGLRVITYGGDLKHAFFVCPAS